jgi:hypothetical protein
VDFPSGWSGGGEGSTSFPNARNYPFVWETPDGRFRFHYALEGPNAVPAEDADGNGVPDYVDTAVTFLNLVWRVLVDTLGFPPPPPDMAQAAPRRTTSIL